jgi:hypothetical protein
MFEVNAMVEKNMISNPDKITGYEIYINFNGEVVGSYKRDVTEKDIAAFHSMLKYLGRTGKIYGKFDKNTEMVASEKYKAVVLDKKQL